MWVFEHRVNQIAHPYPGNAELCESWSRQRDARRTIWMAKLNHTILLLMENLTRSAATTRIQIIEGSGVFTAGGGMKGGGIITEVGGTT